MSKGRLDGQVAWISGGTKGIGEGTAKLFAKEGAKVAITGRNEDDGKRVINDIEKSGGKGIFIKCDMTNEEDIRNSIEKSVEAFGSLQILINNAGIVDIKELHEYSLKDWYRVIDTNVTSIFLSFKFAFPYLKKNKNSYVVNIASISSFVGQSGTPVYTTSKGAVLQLSRSIGLDYARYGIRSNCVCPGITDTPMLHQHIDSHPDAQAHLISRLNRVPLGTILTPNDVARSILFFSCEDSAGVTATSLTVDGGYLAAAEWDCSDFNQDIITSK